MALWVRARDTGIWHWCHNCSLYPGPGLIGDRTFELPSGEMCPECRSREDEGRCGA